MAELTPNNRKEHWLQGIIDGSTELTPNNRVEHLLNGIIEGSTDLIPNKRLEHWLKGIIEGSTDLTPENRLEHWLNDIINGSTELVPNNRIEHWLYEIIQNGGGGGAIKTLTGNAPLTFEALAAALVSLTQDGKTVQDGTPTPDTPVDIVCNNGTLKMRHRSGLPTGYQLLEYVGGSGSQYVITDTYLASTDVIECEYKNSSTTGYGAVYGIYKTGESTALYGNQTYYGYDQANNKVDTGMSVDTDWHSARHDFVNGTLTIDDTTTTFTPWAFTNTTKNAVLSRFYNGSYGYNWKGFVRKFKVMRGNEVICDLLPAKNSNDVAGLYDLISGSFFVATGGTLLEGDVVDDYELIVDGTPEVLTVGGKNLIDPSTRTKPSSNMYRWYNATGFLLKANTAYTFSARSADKTLNVYFYDFETATSIKSSSTGVVTYTPTEDKRVFFAAYVANGIPEDTIPQLEYGSTATAYEPYVAPQTASVANLYAVGDYKDTHELIGGVVTRKVGIKVLDGTESGWALSDSGSTHRFRGVKPSDCRTPASRAPSVCTHFEYVSVGSPLGGMFIGASQYWYFIPTDQTIDTVDEWTAWLAAQYANGTPVIVLYPLAEETTESVQGQALRTEKGGNAISVTSNVDPVALTVEYKGAKE